MQLIFFDWVWVYWFVRKHLSRYYLLEKILFYQKSLFRTSKGTLTTISFTFKSGFCKSCRNVNLVDFFRDCETVSGENVSSIEVNIVIWQTKIIHVASGAKSSAFEQSYGFLRVGPCAVEDVGWHRFALSVFSWMSTASVSKKSIRYVIVFCSPNNAISLPFPLASCDPLE